MIISEPGIYAISADEYHADPCAEPSLSSSIAKLLVTPGTTPLHAFTECPRLNPAHEEEGEEKFDLGKAAHSLMLRDPQEFEIIDAKDWKTKAAQEQRFLARAAGKIPLLPHQFEDATAMVVAGRKQLDAHEEGHHFFVEGKPEMTLCWFEDHGGVRIWFRIRLDWLPNKPPLFPDYKSTAASADPDTWQRTGYAMGVDVQASLYCRGIRALGLCDRPEFRFVVQENFAPFALSVIGLAPGAMDLADRKVERAIQIWKDCRRFNRWPGYPRQTCWIAAPEWNEAQYVNRETRENDASRADLERAARAQAPL